MLIPPNRPQIKREKVLGHLAARGVSLDTDPVVLVAYRGYFRDTMGAPGRNDRGIYDDGFAIISRRRFATFNGNTDPSRYRKGGGFGALKGMAVLNPGVYRDTYLFDMHGRGRPTAHPALCQRLAPVSVTRDGVKSNYQHRGSFGINWHRGGGRSTSSLGCMTVPPGQWDEAYNLLLGEHQHYEGERWRKASPTVVLIDGVPA